MQIRSSTAAAHLLTQQKKWLKEDRSSFTDRTWIRLEVTVVTHVSTHLSLSLSLSLSISFSLAVECEVILHDLA